MVLDGDRAAEGTHAELLAAGRLYATMRERQVRVRLSTAQHFIGPRERQSRKGLEEAGAQQSIPTGQQSRSEYYRTHALFVIRASVSRIHAIGLHYVHA